MDFINSDKNISGVIFFDMDKNGIPEMITSLWSKGEKGQEYKIFGINGVEIRELFNFEIESNIFLFEPNNDITGKLYYGVQNTHFDANIVYYELELKNGKITSREIGKLISNYDKPNCSNLQDFNLCQHWSFYEKYPFNFVDKFYYLGKEVTENEFFKKMHLKNGLNFIRSEDTYNIEKTLDIFKLNNKEYFSYPYISFRDYMKDNSGKEGYIFVKYGNGIYKSVPFSEGSLNLLMLNGSFLTRETAILENDKLFLPIRAIYENIGKYVKYDELSHQLILDGQSFNIDFNEKVIYNGEQKINFKNKKGSIYLPIEFLQNKLNLDSYLLESIYPHTKIIAIEEKNRNLKLKSSIEEAEAIIKNFINKKIIEQKKNRENFQSEYKKPYEYEIKRQELGRYYLFSITHKRELKAIKQEVKNNFLYNKYTGEVFTFNGSILKQTDLFLP